MNGFNPKYKVATCKHYNTNIGCIYGDKCQFAHGEHELQMKVSLNTAENIRVQILTLIRRMRIGV